MASVVTYSGGLRRIEFSLTRNGPRKALRLGRLSHRDAEAVNVHVERLVTAKINGHAVPTTTAAWLGEIGLKLADRLAAAGLIPERDSSAMATFLDAYIRSVPT